MISKLECSKCHFRFNYEFIPGASITAVRLGNRRYMKCPKCGKFSSFSLSDSGKDKDLPTYSDAGITLRYLPIILLPVLAILLSRFLAKNKSNLISPAALIIATAIIIAIVLIFSMKKGASLKKT